MHTLNKQLSLVISDSRTDWTNSSNVAQVIDDWYAQLAKEGRAPSNDELFDWLDKQLCVILKEVVEIQKLCNRLTGYDDNPDDLSADEDVPTSDLYAMKN